MPVTSVICEPHEGANLCQESDKTIRARGYAWSGGGRDIIRVDVSADGGKTWKVKTLIVFVVFYCVLGSGVMTIWGLTKSC